MDILHIVFFGIVGLAGALLMWYKKNRRKLACKRMKRRLTRRLSNGVPSDYLLHALERRFKKITFTESETGVYVRNEFGKNIAYLSCNNGILHGVPIKGNHPDMSQFIWKFEGKPEWHAVSFLMECGGYCTK